MLLINLANYFAEEWGCPTENILISANRLLIRGDSLITASPYYVQDWLKALSGGQLRHKVTEHVQKTMQQTAGL